MKRIIAFLLAVVCAISLAGSGFAAEAEPQTGHQPYFYSTAALEVYNYANFYLSDNEILIVRRGYQEATKPDEATILQGSTVVLSQMLEWEEAPVERGYYGYTDLLEVDALADGEYLLSLESSAVEWVQDAADEPTALRTSYTLATVKFVKEGTECYFPPETGISRRYNGAMLRQFAQGTHPDDFAVLRRACEQQENAQILQEIEAKAAALTAGLHTDLDKCLAIERWITQNIAYDFAFPRESIDQWLKAHPEDAPRLDDPLNAFDRGYAMCYGYAKLTTLMLGYAGVESVYIRGYDDYGSGTALDRGRISSGYSSSWNAGLPASWSYRAADGTELVDAWNHAWNAVNINGSWQYLDTCMGAKYGYFRTAGEDAATGYVQFNQCYSGIYVFPSLGQISNTHLAMRYGADGYGRKPEDV